MTDEQFEYRQQWSQCGGAVAAYRHCVNIIEQAASEAFLASRPEADMLRRLAGKVKVFEEAETAKLRRFIQGKD